METRKEIRASERADYPQLMAARDITNLGLSRAMAYQLLNRDDLPVVVIGTRRFMNRDRFFEWMDRQAANHSEGNSTVSAE